MARLIAFFDGEKLVSEVPEEELPPDMRAVYLYQGVATADLEQADEVIPIARVIRRLVDNDGNEVPREQATRAIIRDFDAQGRVLRTTMMVRTQNVPQS